MRFLDFRAKATCIWEKMCLAPGRASAIERSSPITLCHFFSEILFWVGGTDARISLRRSMRCCGRLMVSATVSSSQPSTSLMVSQVQSPCRNFFNDMGSVQAGSSSGDSGRKTVSIACIKVVRTRFCSPSGPWQMAIKSSTKTST